MKSHLPSFVPNAPFTQAFMHSAQKTKGLLSRLHSATGEKRKKSKKKKKKKKKKNLPHFSNKETTQAAKITILRTLSPNFTESPQ